MKLESRNKKQFINTATGIVLKTINEKIDESKSVSIKIIVKSNNRYFAFHRYGADLNISIFKSGDVDICFKEFAHSDEKIRVVVYEDVLDNQEAVLKQFNKDVEMIISAFLFYDWHIFMDYLLNIFPCVEGIDWRQRICNFIKDMEHEKEEESKNE